MLHSANTLMHTFLIMFYLITLHFMCEYFACTSICAPVYPVPMEARRGHQTVGDNCNSSFRGPDAFSCTLRGPANKGCT